MIIKRWDNTTDPNAPVWVNEAPKTTAASIYTTTSFATSLFDGNNRLKVEYLPDNVFGGLKFSGTITNADVDTAAELAGIVETARAALQNTTIGKSIVGLYWVAAETISDLAASGTIQDSVTGTIYWCINDYVTMKYEEGATDLSTITLEAGDWLVLSDVVGSGTSGSPYGIKFQVVNNTYQTATSSAYGIVKLGDDTAQSVDANAVTTTASRTYAIQGNGSGQLVVNVPWSDTNTTYTAGTGLVLTNTEFKVDLIDYTPRSVTAETITTTANRTYAVMPDADGDLVVNVPWSDTDTNTTYTAGTGLTLDGTVFNANVSETPQSTAANAVTGTASRTYAIQVDASDNLVVNVPWVDTNTTYSAGNGIALSAGQFSVAAGQGLTQETSGLAMTYPVYHGDTLPTLTNEAKYSNVIGFEW